LVEIVVAAVWGGLTVFLTGLILYYRSEAKFWRGEVAQAEVLRDEAVTLSAKALEAKDGAEEGFKKAKDFFDERNKIPLLAIMTDEQCGRIAKYLEEHLLGFSKSTGMIQ
jgi:hypothetical protein